ncbi:hypothetical protein EYF80_063316 [Liparis tanakae]|uniref:Uncharacterized protein n=1 Tax=Liparis tanakae TaxID=230148 RepID=A0A4Z2ECQ5_9TELE|nr:hypothetical protein EYF80_063316 [Liparis tanakae]
MGDPDPLGSCGLSRTPWGHVWYHKKTLRTYRREERSPRRRRREDTAETAASSQLASLGPRATA